MSEEKKVREPQEPHTKAECEINEEQYSHPDVDCGHSVDAGPGFNQGPDKNTYFDDHGKKGIVCDKPQGKKKE